MESEAAELYAMAFPNVSDLIATSIEQRSGEIADNVTNNNIILAVLKQKGNVKPFDGGRLIYEELSFAENSNGNWYNGYDILPVGPQDVLSAAEFSIKQYAVAVTVSGLEKLQNSGKSQIIDLVAGRIDVAEGTMANDIATGLYSDGTGADGKQIVGLDAAVPANPATGIYGGINRATASNAFWKSYIKTEATTSSNVQTQLNTAWANLVRGTDHPNLVIMGSTFWGLWMASLQNLQRFTSPEMAKLGFETQRFMQADVYLDGGIGGAATATNAYLLNTKYLKFRPHKDRNMVPLSPDKRYAINQDASVSILAWAGAFTCSGAKFQGRITGA